MNTFNDIIRIFSANLIKGMFWSVIVLIFSKKIFKNRFDSSNAVVIIKFIMVGFSTLLILQFLLGTFLVPKSNAFFTTFWDRATGRYWFALWLMVLGAISPLLLIFKKLGSNVFVILVLTIFINIGWLMESLVIHITIARRDYSPIVDGFKVFIPSEGAILFVLQGIIFGVIAIGIGNLPFFKKINAV